MRCFQKWYRPITNLFKTEIVHLKEDSKTFLNKAQQTKIFLEKIQTEGNLFKERFSTLEKETVDLTYKTQSITMGAETLFERISTIECINRTLSKGYDRLTDRMSLQEGNIHAKKIMSKDEILSLMHRLHNLESSMRALEQNTGQEIQTLQKAIVNRFEKIEEIINFDDQEQKVRRQNLTSSVHKTLWDSFPRVIPASPVIT